MTTQVMQFGVIDSRLLAIDYFLEIRIGIVGSTNAAKRRSSSESCR
jgi:hypothetical protein